MSNLWEIGLGTDQLRRDSERAKELLNGISQKAITESSKIDEAFNKIGKYATGYFSVQAAAGFIKEVANVRGEFQKLEVGFTTMLGSKEKSNALMTQMVDTAAKTPFTLQEVANGAKQLLAYQIAQEDVNKTLIQLGNISAGLGVPLDRLILVYGQVKAKGKLMGDDLRQFTEAGVPMIHELAKQMGVADGEVQKLISSGKIGFPQVQKVIESLTSSGGMFYNLMAEQSKTITGQISNLEDAWTKMLNSIGESNQGVISDALGGITSLVNNYEDVGKSIVELIAVYGTYKAVLVTLNTIHAIQEGMALQRALNINVETGERIALSTAEAFGAVVETNLSAAQARLNDTMLANPYVLVAAGVAALGFGMYKLITYQTDSEKAQKKLNDTIESTKKEISGETIELDRLFANLKNSKKGTEEYKVAKDTIFNKYGSYLKSLGDENTALNDQAKAYETIKNNIISVANAKGFEQSTKTAQDDYSNSIINTKNSVQQILEGKFGKNSKLSIDYMVKLNPIIEKGGDENSIKKEFKKLFDFTEYIGGGPDTQVKVEVRNQLVDLLNANAASKQIYENVVATAKVKFNQTGSNVNTPSATTTTTTTLTDEEIATAKKVAKEKKRIQEEIAKEKIRSERKLVDEEFQIRQSNIDLAKDSYTKELAQLILNHDKKLEEIKRAKEDELRVEQDKQEKIWELNAPRDSKGEVVGSFDKSKVKMSSSASSTINNATTNENNAFTQQKLELDKKYLDSLLEQYKSFQQKKESVNNEFTLKETTLTDSINDNNKSQIEQALSVLRQEHKDTLQQLGNDESDFISSTSELFVKLFGDASKKSVSDIRSIVSESKSIYEYLSKTPENKLSDGFGFTKEQLSSMKGNKGLMADMKGQIDSLTQIADKGDLVFGEFGGNVKKMFDGFGKGKNSVGDLQKGMEGLKGTFQSVSFFAGQAQGLLNAMSTEEGDAASSAAKSIGAVMDVANSTMQGFQQGGYVGAAIAFTMSIATKVFESEKAHQAALKKLNDEKIAQQKEYNDLLIKENALIKNADTIFGSDGYSKALGYAQQADKYRELLNSKEKTKVSGGGSLFGITIPEIYEYKGAIAALNNATVQTGSHKTGLFGWGGEKADYSSLLKTYPDLIDGQGNLNKELAQSILDNKSLDDSSKKALQSALDYTKDYEEALQGMKDYLTSVFGSLGSDMMSAITDNLNSSQDAMDAFGKSAGKTIEKLMSDIAYSMFFADKFKKMQDQALAIQSDNGKTPEQKAAEQTKLLGDFYSGIGTEVKSAQDWLKENKAMASQSGFDLWNEATRTATSKGFASMSQDSADELNGRFTAVQGHTFAISEGMKILQANSAQSLKHLAGIETNTARLEAVENGINSVKQGIETINLKGVKLQ